MNPSPTSGSETLGRQPFKAGLVPALPTLMIGREADVRALKARLGVVSELSLHGDKVAFWRNQRGMTQEELAKKAGRSLRTIQEIESGRNAKPYSDTIEAVAAALAVPRQDLKRPAALTGLTVIRGWPGTGKTTLMAYIAHDPEIAAAFPDGVLWTSLGKNPDLGEQLRRWCRALGLPSPTLAERNEELSQRLGAALRDRAALLLVDDVWATADAIPFRLAGHRCGIILSTRLNRVADELAPTPGDVYKLDVLNEDSSLELLRCLAPDVVAEYQADCRELVREVEGLPLALQVAGRLLRAEVSRGFSVTALLHDLRTSSAKLLLEKVPSDLADIVQQTTPTVAALLRKSTESLKSETRERFALLGVFAPKPATFDLGAIAAVWKVEDPRQSIRILVDRGLLEAVAPNRFQMHALLVALARSHCEE